MLLLLFARQTYVWCTTIARWKYGSYEHRTLRVSSRLKSKLFVTPTTGTPNVQSSYVATSITSMRFLTLWSATGAMKGKTRSTRMITSSSSSSVYSLRPNNLVQEEHIYNTHKYKSSEVHTNRYIFIQGKNINKKEQTIESLLMLDFSIKDHNRKTTKRSRQHQQFLK